jgi:hypothetical protein
VCLGPKPGPPLTGCHLSLLGTISSVVSEVVCRLDQKVWIEELLSLTTMGASFFINKHGCNDHLHVSKVQYGLVHHVNMLWGRPQIEKVC